MYSWFRKLRTCSSLDEPGFDPERVRRGALTSPDSREAVEDALLVDSELKRTIPRAEAPEFLHSGIMSAVRSAAHAVPHPARPFRWELAVGFGLVLAAFSAWFVADLRSGPAPKPDLASSPALSAPDKVLELGSQLSRAVPEAMVSPMARELEMLNRDLDSTRARLMASLP